MTGCKIVVGYDGSDAARAALGYALERAGEGGEVWLVHSFEPPPDWMGAPNYQRVLAEHRERGQELLDAALAPGNGAPEGVRVSTELIGEPAPEAIVRVAQAREADEIAIGSRGFGRFRGALGSVSRELLHLADRPVVVIPQRYAEGSRD